MAKPEHEVAYQDLVRLLSKHAAKISAEEMLAIASNLLGKLVAMQDQRTMTRERALETVMKNVEYGNQQVVNELAGGAAGRG
jgi:hypothetical protein